MNGGLIILFFNGIFITSSSLGEFFGHQFLDAFNPFLDMAFYVWNAILDIAKTMDQFDQVVPCNFGQMFLRWRQVDIEMVIILCQEINNLHSMVFCEGRHFIDDKNN